MKKLKIGKKIIYRASEGKKVKFEDNKRLYDEIAVDKDDKRKVREVEDADL